MAATILRTLALNFVARTQNALKGIEKIQKRIGQFSSGVTRVAAIAGTALAAVGVSLSVGKVVSMVKAQSELVDSLAKTSDQLGISTENLAAFQLQAELAGVSSEQFSKSISTMVRNLATNKQARSIASKIGIDLQKLDKQSPDQIFLDIADAISKTTNAQDRLIASTKIFGEDAGVKLISMLMEGRKGFESASKDARSFGLAVSRFDAANIELANDAINKATKLLDGMARSLAVKIAPYIEAIANGFTTWARNGTAAASAVTSAFNALGEAVFFVGTTIDKTAQLMQRLAIVGKTVQGILEPIYTLDFTTELEQKRQGELSAMVAELEKMQRDPYFEDALSKAFERIQNQQAQAARLARNQILETPQTSLFGGSAGSLTGRTIQGPQGLSRGSAEAAAAEARFLNRQSGGTDAVKEQKKTNQKLDTLIRETRRNRGGAEITIN